MDSQIIELIIKELDTRDKRYMFLKILFPASLALINLEGAPKNVAWAMAQHFKNQGESSFESFSYALTDLFTTK